MSDQEHLASDHLLFRLRLRAKKAGDDRLVSMTPEQTLALVECAEALQIARGQWIHSVNAEKCLAALAKLEAL